MSHMSISSWFVSRMGVHQDGAHYLWMELFLTFFNIVRYSVFRHNFSGTNA